MPIYHPNSHISDCWGSAGNVTFYHRDGVCYWRTRDQHEFSGTYAQLDALEVHRRALAAWHEIPDDVKEQWREFASEVEPHKPPFDGSARITGHNLFVSAYHGFATLGDEHVPSPMQWSGFPLFNLEYVSAASKDGFLHAHFRVWFSGADDCNRYAVLGKVAVSAPGTGCKTSQLRNYLGMETEESGVIEFVIRSDAEDSCQLHIRYALIDSETGYRSQYQRSSILVVIH